MGLSLRPEVVDANYGYHTECVFKDEGFEPLITKHWGLVVRVGFRGRVENLAGSVSHVLMLAPWISYMYICQT